MPWVVTGLKAWHVHLGGGYFTGACLRRAFELILAREGTISPTNTIECLLSAGEIDVREGLAHAVEKQKYKDLRTGKVDEFFNKFGTRS